MSISVCVEVLLYCIVKKFKFILCQLLPIYLHILCTNTCTVLYCAKTSVYVNADVNLLLYKN
jgi:hypothetical protein